MRLRDGFCPIIPWCHRRKSIGQPAAVRLRKRHAKRQQKESEAEKLSMKNTMFYEEYEKFVWDFLSEYAVSKAYPENVKKELACAKPLVNEESMEIRGRDAVTGLPIYKEIT